jgi:protein ImuA
MRLLAPALAKVASKSVILIQPPQTPQALAFASMGIGPSQIVWIKSRVSADALWAAEQTLRSGCCGAVLLWLSHVRQENLRRLHLAAQSGNALFYVLRPVAAAQDACPSPLRLSIRPAAGGVNIEFVKRRGPQREDVLFVPLLTGAIPARTRDRPHLPSDVPSVPVPVPAPTDRAPSHNRVEMADSAIFVP